MNPLLSVKRLVQQHTFKSRLNNFKKPLGQNEFMQKVRVFYTPTQANGYILPRAIELGRLKEKCELELIALSSIRETRRRELQSIEGRAACVFGSGWYHDDSYYFTPRSVRLKINIDHHDDMEPGDHMNATQAAGIEIITPTNTMFPEAYNKRFPSSSRLRIMRLALEAGLKRGMEFGANEIAATLDADAIYGFPADDAYIYDYGLSPGEAIEAIKILAERLLRFDFCGLLDEIPDFNVIKGFSFADFEKELRNSKDSIPIYVYGFSTAAGRTAPPSEEERRKFDMIGTYATLIYAKLLEAFIV
ncbi:MAG: hypothetical protein PHS02_02120 [Candidatus ainarchaeum sp.]|nr:hypothetical protein [Candidatus ainarchaeum sp.]